MDGRTERERGERGNNGRRQASNWTLMEEEEDGHLAGERKKERGRKKRLSINIVEEFIERFLGGLLELGRKIREVRQPR